MKHGLSKTRLYRTWNNMKQRCYNPKNPNYASYGGRGITIYQEWLDDFQRFYDWAMANGYSDELTIDRIDGTKGYFPDNCRWVTWEENNMRGNAKVENDITRIRSITGLSQPQFCEKYGIPLPTLRHWELGDRKCPQYMLDSLEIRVKNDMEGS